MLEEKLREAIVAELKRQAANNPKSLSVEVSESLVVKGKIDLDDLTMVIAGAVAGWPIGLDPLRANRNRDCRRTFSRRSFWTQR